MWGNVDEPTRKHWRGAYLLTVTEPAGACLDEPTIYDLALEHQSANWGDVDDSTWAYMDACLRSAAPVFSRFAIDDRVFVVCTSFERREMLLAQEGEIITIY